jgi:hypothetical protein
MSIKATSWAYQQTVGRSSAKFLLVTLAGYVKYKDESFEAWCTIECLHKRTELNRKTIIQNLKYLLERKFIVHTGKYMGQFRNCPVYQLTYKGRQEVARYKSLWYQEQDERQDAPSPIRSGFFHSSDLTSHEAGNDPLYLISSAAPVEHQPVEHQPVYELLDLTPALPCQPVSDDTKVADDTRPGVADSQIAIKAMKPHGKGRLKTPAKRPSARKAAPQDGVKQQTGSNRPAPQAGVQTQGTRLPEKWTLPAYWAQWAAGYLPNWDVTEIVALSKIFHAHYRHAVGDKGRSEDWFAGWRLWVLSKTTKGSGAGSQHASRGKPASNYHDQLRQMALEVGLGDAWPGESTAAYQARIVAARASRSNGAGQRRFQ